MEVERLVEEYVKRKDMLDALTKQVAELKDMLSKKVDLEGEVDEKGHKWFTAGRFLLQRQKRQGDKYLNRAAAEAWAKEAGFWEAVKIVKEELNEDALLGYVYEHRKDIVGIEESLESLYTEPPVTWAFQKPIVQEQYDY